VDASTRWPEGLAVAGILRPEPSQSATDEDGQGSWGHILAASLAMHGGLREDLVQGLCLFRLAGYRSYDGREPDETRGAEILALLQSKVALTAAAVRFAFPPNTSHLANVNHFLFSIYDEHQQTVDEAISFDWSSQGRITGSLAGSNITISMLRVKLTSILSGI